MLTSRADEADKIRGFSQGADYLTKPFSLGVRSRVGGDFEAGRLSTAEKQSIFEKLMIDPERREVTLNNQQYSCSRIRPRFSQPSRSGLAALELIQGLGLRICRRPRVVDVHIGQIRRRLKSIRPSQF